MRILHLNWLPDPGPWPGIVRKLREQARAARGCGLPLTVAVLSCERCEVDGDGLRWMPIRYPLATGRRAQRMLTRLDCIHQSIDPQRWDAVILRYPGASDCSFGGILDALQGRLITEHHTNTLAEMATLAQGMASRAKWWMERLRGPSLLGRVAGLVGVTEEIRKVESERGQVARSCVIANGCDVAGMLPVQCARWTGDELHLLFAASFAPWHGLDRLVAGLALHRGSRVILHIAGDVPLNMRIDAHPGPSATVVAHGRLLPADLHQLAGGCHVAVSSLALHRAGLSEGCPLKTREYVAQGLPVVMAYQDTDLPDSLPGILRLPAGDDPIDVSVILTFMSEVGRDHDAITSGLRAFAMANLDWRPKLSRLVTFVEGVVGGGPPISPPSTSIRP